MELLLDDSRRVAGRAATVAALDRGGLLLLVAMTAVAFCRFRDAPRAAAAPVRFQIPLDVSVAPSGNIGLSPDGRQLAFLGVGADGLYAMSSERSIRLKSVRCPGLKTRHTDRRSSGRPTAVSLAFDAGGVLKKLNVAGGPPDTLCELSAAAIGGSWNGRGDILVGNLAGGILVYRTPAEARDCRHRA